MKIFLKGWKKNYQPRMLYPDKISFKSQGEKEKWENSLPTNLNKRNSKESSCDKMKIIAEETPKLQ